MATEESEPTKYDVIGTFSWDQVEDVTKKHSSWIRPGDGDAIIIKIIPGKGGKEVKEYFQGKGDGYYKYHIQVIDVNDGGSVKTLSASKILLSKMGACVNAGYNTLKITRHGKGKDDTRYYVKPIMEEEPEVVE